MNKHTDEENYFLIKTDNIITGEDRDMSYIINLFYLKKFPRRACSVLVVEVYLFVFHDYN